MRLLTLFTGVVLALAGTAVCEPVPGSDSLATRGAAAQDVPGKYSRVSLILEHLLTSLQLKFSMIQTVETVTRATAGACPFVVS
jgi:hypothetical protein